MQSHRSSARRLLASAGPLQAEGGETPSPSSVAAADWCRAGRPTEGAGSIRYTERSDSPGSGTKGGSVLPGIRSIDVPPRGAVIGYAMERCKMDDPNAIGASGADAPMEEAWISPWPS